MDIERFLQNNKTSYLAESYKRLEKEEEETKQMILSDPTLRDLAQTEIEGIQAQKDALLKQMEEILRED